MALVTCSECRSQVSDRAVSCPHCGNVFTRCPECANEVGQIPTALASSASAQLLADNTQYFGAAGVATAVVYAGFWRRFVAAIIDAILVAVVLIVADIVLGAIVDARSTTFATISSGLSIGVGVAYYVGQESGRKQATLGKRALGIIVTDLQGNRISNGRAVGRYFAKLLSALTLAIGYFMAGFTEKKQALHDMIAGTLVVVKPTNR
jgi:uncharacterized RDD family membrane protein YckC